MSYISNHIKLCDLIPESKKLCGVTIDALLDTFLKLEGKTLIMFDLETLGLDPAHDYAQITEVAAWAVSGDDFKIIEKLNFGVTLSDASEKLLSDPNGFERFNWERIRRKRKDSMTDPNDILKMTRYYELKCEFKNEKSAITEFVDFVSKYDNRVLVAHNAGFDVKFIGSRASSYGMELPSAEVVDTLKISRYFFGPAIETLSEHEDAVGLFRSLFRNAGQHSHISSKLGELATAFKMDSENWHTASADVEMMHGVMVKMLEFLKEHHDTDISRSQERAIFRQPKKRKPTKLRKRKK